MARLLRRDGSIVHEAAGAQNEPQKANALAGNHLLARFVPIRLQVFALHQVRGRGFDPHGLDFGDTPREHAGSFHDAGSHDPAGTATRQRRTRKDMETHTACPKVGAILAPRSHHGAKAREQRAVHARIACLRALRHHPKFARTVHHLGIDVIPFGQPQHR